MIFVFKGYSIIIVYSYNMVNNYFYKLKLVWFNLNNLTNNNL